LDSEFYQSTLGNTGITVSRLGLSATYRPGKGAIYRALDAGVNYFFCYGFDTQMIGVLRDITKEKRDAYTVATGAYNLLWFTPNIRRTLEKRLRQLHTDYIDVFLFLGVTRESHFSVEVRQELCRLREEGKVRAIGISTHNRTLAGKLAAEGALDVIMMRYNAAHRGAEQEIFPHLDRYNPGIVSYTATCWRRLLKRPRGWPRGNTIPSAGMCYRFVLTNPHVDVCMTAPSNKKHLEENLASFREGPLSDEEMAFMQRFGDAVHRSSRWSW
jgi:aryl-alcohol dehydrogenase-like predicted oxidoreductase